MINLENTYASQGHVIKIRDENLRQPYRDQKAQNVRFIKSQRNAIKIILREMSF